MIAADNPDRRSAQASDRRRRTAACGICRAQHLATLFGPATWSSPTMPRPCRQASHGTHVAERRADRDPPRRLGVVRRSDPLRWRSPSAPAIIARARKTGRPRRRLSPGDRLALGPLDAVVERLLGHPRLVALRFTGSREHDPGRARAARPADPVRARARAAGAVGRVDVASPPTRWRSRRRRPALRSTGAHCMPGGSAASVSPRSPMPPASRRPAIPCSTSNCRSTSRTAFPPRTAAAIVRAQIGRRAHHRDRHDRRARAGGRGQRRRRARRLRRRAWAHRA